MNSLLEVEDVGESFHDVMSMVSFRLGQWSAQAEMAANQIHTCKESHLRYPWPPQQGCSGCEREIQKWAKRFHLEMPLLLFGWQAVIDEAERAIQRKIDQAEVNRNKGAYI